MSEIKNFLNCVVLFCRKRKRIDPYLAVLQRSFSDRFVAAYFIYWIEDIICAMAFPVLMHTPEWLYQSIFDIVIIFTQYAEIVILVIFALLGVCFTLLLVDVANRLLALVPKTVVAQCTGVFNSFVIKVKQNHIVRHFFK